MKRSYLIEYTWGLGEKSFQIRSARSDRLLYQMEIYFLTGDLVVFQIDEETGERRKVAVAEYDQADWFRSSASLYAIRTRTETGRTTAEFRDTTDFFGPKTFSLTSDQGWVCAFADFTGFCSPTEYKASWRHQNGNGSCTLADMTDCCGYTTFGVAFDDSGDEDFQITFLIASALVQYAIIKQRQQSAISNGAMAASNGAMAA